MACSLGAESLAKILSSLSNNIHSVFSPTHAFSSWSVSRAQAFKITSWAYLEAYRSLSPLFVNYASLSFRLNSASLQALSKAQRSRLNKHLIRLFASIHGWWKLSWWRYSQKYQQMQVWLLRNTSLCSCASRESPAFSRTNPIFWK
jgi:hypothetical protein